MGVHIDVDGAAELKHDLNEAQQELRKDLKQVTSKGALNIKNDWAKRWREYAAYLPHLPRAINYDLDVRDGGLWVEAEIGVDQSKRQHSIGHILELGSVHNAPHPGGAPALKAEEPRYEQAIQDLLTRTRLLSRAAR